MTWQALNLASDEFGRKTPPPVYCGLFYRGRRHYVSGPPESLKTVFAWTIARNVVREHGEAVACIDFEMGPNATCELLENLGWTLSEIESVYYVEPDGPPSGFDLNSIVDAGVALAIVDSAPGAFNATDLDDNSRKDAEKFAQAWIEPLYRRDVSTLVIDHVTKNSETRGKYAIGSERKVGGADVHLGLEAVKTLTRGGNGLVKLRVHKDRPGWLHRPYAAELELHSDPRRTRSPGSSASKPYRTPSDLVPTSSDEDGVTSSTSSPAYRRDEDGDEDEDEVTLLAHLDSEQEFAA